MKVSGQQAFANDWIEKLKTDMRSHGAEIAVIVTKAMPKDMDCFGIKDGVWICSFGEVKALAAVLRDGVIRVFNAQRTRKIKVTKCICCMIILPVQNLQSNGKQSVKDL